MDAQKEYRHQFTDGIRRIDGLFLKYGRRLAALFNEYRYLLAVLLIGFIVWSVVFNIALVDYLGSSSWNTRGVWLGAYTNPGEFNLFGYTIVYQFEGYTDYSFFYVHWGYNMLNGTLPYSPEFGHLVLDGIANDNGLYMFPPLTAYLYAAGILLGNILGPGNWGIGFLLASFGYLTALPVYGIGKELSKNPRVGEIAALTYLLNPLVLYHIDYVWLNPSAFYFFFFAGFYALLKDRRHIGTILIITAALFKQTAWFLGIPLVIFLLLRKRQRPNDPLDTASPLPTPDKKEKKGHLAFLTHYFDFRAFAVSVVIGAIYAGAIMLPTLIAQPHFWDYWRIAMGSFRIEDFTEFPNYGVPESLPVLAIGAGMPDVAVILESILTTGMPLVFGTVVIAGLMVLLDKVEGEEIPFMRRLLFLTMLLMLWVSLTGPRGVFKYYFTLFGPFFSIYSSGRMITSKEDHVPVSLSMFLMPFTFTLLILVPDRNVYLLYAVLIFLLYLAAPIITRLYDLVKRPFRRLRNILSHRITIQLQSSKMDYTPSGSRLTRGLKITITISSALIGSVLLLLGVYISFTNVSAALSIILQSFMLSGVMIVLGAQILSFAANGFSQTDEKQDDLSYVLRTYSFSTAAIVLIFGCITYALSWNIDLYLERQALVIGGTMIALWALALILQLKKHIRLLASLIVLSGAALATWTFWLLEDAIMYHLGLVCVAALSVYIMFVLIEFLNVQDIDDGFDDTKPLELESPVQ